MKTFLFYVLLLFLLPAAVAHADLTGRWSCNDGGLYYLKEHDGTVYGYGEGKGVPPAWATVFSGRIDDDRITGTWAHVPKGRASGAGALELTIEADGEQLRAAQSVKGLNGTRWTRLDASVKASIPTASLQPTAGKGCVSFDSETLTVQQENGRWRIISGAHWLFDFGTDSDAVHRAFSILRHYRMKQVCTVGTSTPPFTYMLAHGGIPAGAMAGEDCVAIDPARVTAQRIQNRWKIVSDRRVVYDFGTREGDARQAVAVIKRHGFTQVCYAGRPASAFSYLRQ
ncbi:hypothetical protein LJC22_01075 [Desulfosarcina sp. OttesenSCG-928-G10]|nr:hypothetical protein [Desulfosarcina sp. OttesenSCG-928-G10]